MTASISYEEAQRILDEHDATCPGCETCLVSKQLYLRIMGAVVDTMNELSLPQTPVNVACSAQMLVYCAAVLLDAGGLQDSTVDMALVAQRMVSGGEPKETSS